MPTYQLRWRCPNGTEFYPDASLSGTTWADGKSRRSVRVSRFDVLVSSDKSYLLKEASKLIQDQRYVVLMTKVGSRWMRSHEWRDGGESRFGGLVR